MSSERQIAARDGDHSSIRMYDIENFRDFTQDRHVFDQVIIITDPRDSYIDLRVQSAQHLQPPVDTTKSKTSSAGDTRSTPATDKLRVMLNDIMTYATSQGNPEIIARLRKKYKSPIHSKFERINMVTMSHVTGAIIASPVAPTMHILENRAQH